MTASTRLEVGPANYGAARRAASRRRLDYPLSADLRAPDPSDIRDFLHHLAARGRSAKTQRTYAQLNALLD